jgi:methionine aminotransferase
MAFKFESKIPAAGISIFARMTTAAIQYQAINLAQGFPNYNPPKELSSYLEEAVSNGFNQYAQMPGFHALRQQIGNRIERDYNYKANIDTEITVTAGATQAIYTIISAFVNPGDKVLIFEPAYDSYGPAVIVNGGIPVYLRLELPDFGIPWNQLETLLLTDQFKMILFNNPHNPAGRILSQEDLLKIERLSRNNNTLLIWDEVYDLLVFDGKKHCSALENSALMQRSCVVFSMGKTLHNTGWKIGYCIARQEITNEIRKLHQFTVFSVNTPAQYAIAVFMEKYPDFFSKLPEFYQEKRDFFFEKMKTTPFNFYPCEGSYFALANYRHLSEKGDLDYAMELAEIKKVAVIPISAFYHDGFDPGILRFCFAKTKETIEEAAIRLSI